MQKLKSLPNSLSQELYGKFCNHISESLGLYFSQKDKDEVERKLQAASADLGFSNTIECVHWLVRDTLNDEQILVLAKYFTVGETYFFRDHYTFQLLENKIFAGLIHRRQNERRYLRIWCAACCSGEEPYSIAMLLDQMIPNIKEWDILILGTDINRAFLEKASKGVYKEWSFRTTPETVREKYFTKEKEGTFRILPRINKMVKFSYLNLIEDKYPALINQTHTMDLILCNNVLIYFSKEKIRFTINQLTESLVEGGHLIVSPLEVPYVENKKLVSTLIDEVTLFRKESTPKMETYLPELQEKPKPGKKIAAASYLVPPKTVPKKVEIEEEKESVYMDLYNAGHYDDLIKKLERKLEHSKKNTSNEAFPITLLARAYANRGDFKKARNWLEKVLQTDKLNHQTYFFYATLLQELGEYTEAARALTKAIFLNQNFALGYYTLGNVLMRIGNNEAAERNYRNAMALLEKMEKDSFIEESEGITAGLLMEIISSVQKQIYSKR